MTDNKNTGCLYYAALAAFGTATFLVGATVGYGIGKYPDTDEKTPTYEASIESQKGAAICDLAIAPLRNDFIGKCTIDNFERGTVLRKIREQKDQILEDLNCPARRWECKPNEKSDLERGVHVEFGYK